MTMMDANIIIQSWPDESKEAAELVLDKYGEPDEETPSLLVWYNPGPWKRIHAYREFSTHNFPAPHTDSVESFINYDIPPKKFNDLAKFDGSVMAARTSGELSACCHDEEANFLAINLADDIVTGKSTAKQARDYYAEEFADVRRGEPAPYMQNLKFKPPGNSGDPDKRALSEKELQTVAERNQPT